MVTSNFRRESIKAEIPWTKVLRAPACRVPRCRAARICGDAGLMRLEILSCGFTTKRRVSTSSQGEERSERHGISRDGLAVAAPERPAGATQFDSFEQKQAGD